MACTPGGIGSNIFAIALNANVEINAILTLTGILSGFLLLPGVFQMALPVLLDQEPEVMLSPFPILLSNLMSMFIP
eukprot:5523164-Prymnesium_polylepis.1